jgi:hypothetical protein
MKLDKFDLDAMPHVKFWFWTWDSPVFEPLDLFQPTTTTLITIAIRHAQAINTKKIHPRHVAVQDFDSDPPFRLRPWKRLRAWKEDILKTELQLLPNSPCV